MCEFFAGDGALSKSAKYGMIACAQLDVEYGKTTTRVHKQNAFDLLQPAGLAFLELVYSFEKKDNVPNLSKYIHVLMLHV